MFEDLDEIVIRINSWEKYNPNRNQKNYTWLRLDNKISIDPDLFDLTPEQRYAWIEILCQASRSNNCEVKLTFRAFSHVTKVQNSSIYSLLLHLEKKQIISICRYTPADAPVTTTPTYERKKERTYSSTIIPDKPSFDLEAVYLLYPRKKEKGRGLKKLSKQIKTQKDYDDLVKAVTNYANEQKQLGTKENFIKLFSSFATEEVWRDYVEIETQEVKPKFIVRD